ncbi:MAG TPA: Ig-like domain-containing protein, partial [Magnetovibrio sp.]
IADLTVTSLDGDAALVGQQIDIAAGITFVLGADGALNVDASGADYLSEGETLTGSYTYGVYDGNGGSDSATISVNITGVNDAPLALADLNATDEATLISGNVLDNDSDVDRLDTISVSSVNGDTAGVGSLITLASGAEVVLNADGTYRYDPNGAFDHLNTGETATDSFSYTITDDHGATSEALVEISIAGIGGGNSGGGISEGDHFATFANKKGTADHAISNIVMYLKGDTDDITKVKIDGWNGGETDLDNVDLNYFLANNFANYDVMAVSIKAGNNHNRDLGPGEGQLFLIDGDSDIDYVAGGDVPEGLTGEDLAAHADISFDYSASLFG